MFSNIVQHRCNVNGEKTILKKYLLKKEERYIDNIILSIPVIKKAQVLLHLLLESGLVGGTRFASTALPRSYKI